MGREAVFRGERAVHDAGCAVWPLKRYYDGWRPISAVRYMGGLGRSSEPQSPSYHLNGLPLIPELIELVTSNTVASGRHTNLTVGKIAPAGVFGAGAQRPNSCPELF